jgi:aminobenzoyl-glutamate transport protein
MSEESRGKKMPKSRGPIPETPGGQGGGGGGSGVEAPKGWVQRVLDKVEVGGNKLPQPVTLFAILMLMVLVASWIAGMMNITAVHPGTGEAITAVNLLSADGIRRIFTEMVTVFANFPPLGLVLVVMLGIGVSERSGFIAAALKSFVSGVPKMAITFSIVTAGMLSSVAADAGYVVLIPLGAAIFASMGRHPLAGLAAAFAGVSGGFGANLFPTGLDPLLAAFTEPASQIVDPGYTVNPLCNWWIMAASVPVVAIAGTFVTERIIEPRLGKWDATGFEVVEEEELSRVEKKGLLWAMVSVVVFLGIFTVLSLPAVGVFYDVSRERAFDPLYGSIVPIMTILFFVPGLVYGIVTGSITGDKQVAKMTADSMATMGGYIVLAFVAAQFVAYFNWSNIGIIMAIFGADGLQAVGFTGMPLIVSFIIVSSIINIAIGSASAKWAILAPIFVPMLMLMGYSPEATQAAYRIGDSYSNILTPLLPYFPLVITFAAKYVKDIGIGTIISLMLPFAVAFALVRIPMFVVWLLLGLPLGLEAPIYYEP